MQDDPATVVGVHQGESWTCDRLGNSQSLTEALREGGLPRSHFAGEDNHITRSRQLSQRRGHSVGPHKRVD